jgi:hypothetical protein
MKKAYVKPTLRSRAIRPGDIEAGARFAQKRAVPRYPFAANATLREPITRKELAGKTSDISLNGCFIESVDQFPPKTIVRVRVDRAAESFETWGRVAHVQAALGTGVSFFDTSTDQHFTLAKWVAETAQTGIR